MSDPVRPVSIGNAEWDQYLLRYKDRVGRIQIAVHAGDNAALNQVLMEAEEDPVTEMEIQAWGSGLSDAPLVTGSSRVAIGIHASEDDLLLEQKHMGPGPHPSGSDQDVHAGDGAGGRTLYGGTISEMSEEDQETHAAMRQHRFSLEGTWHRNYPEGKFPIQDPDNPEGMAWLEGRDAIVEYIERDIVNRGREHGAHMNENGSVFIEATGDDRSMTFGREDHVLIDRAVLRRIDAGGKVTFTHNHPRQFYDGGATSLSNTDVFTALKRRLSEIRATTTGGVYFMKFVEGDHPNENKAILLNQWSAIYNELKDFGGVPHLDARHRAWQKTAEFWPDIISEYGFEPRDFDNE